MRIAVAAGVCTLVGCWSWVEHGMEQRVLEMHEHAGDGFRAVRALERGDLREARVAGRGLARDDSIRSMPDAARPHLERLRMEGRRLAKASDTTAAAEAVVAVTVHCAACHADVDVEPVSWADTPAERAWEALSWDDLAAWEAAAADLGDPALTVPEDWEGRRAAFVQRLAAVPVR